MNSSNYVWQIEKYSSTVESFMHSVIHPIENTDAHIYELIRIFFKWPVAAMETLYFHQWTKKWNPIEKKQESILKNKTENPE